VLQGSKSLAHVVELAQSGVELSGLGQIGRLLSAPAVAAADEIDDEQRRRGEEGNERGS